MDTVEIKEEVREVNLIESYHLCLNQSQNHHRLLTYVPFKVLQEFLPIKDGQGNKGGQLNLVNVSP